MSVEFVDTNILLYAHDRSAGHKHQNAVDLLTRLFDEGNGGLSTQVLSEFYSAGTKKLSMKSQEAEEVITGLAGWAIHRPGHSDALRACQLCRRYSLGWRDAFNREQRDGIRLLRIVE
jgi:predicted nucleic acid-binding protein